MKIFKFFSGHYLSAWNPGNNSDDIINTTKAWAKSVDGLTDTQVNYGIAKISLGDVYLKFPPNAGEFRNLCKGSQDPSHILVKLDYTHVRKFDGPGYLEFKRSREKQLAQI